MPQNQYQNDNPERIVIDGTSTQGMLILQPSYVTVTPLAHQERRILAEQQAVSTTLAIQQGLRRVDPAENAGESHASGAGRQWDMRFLTTLDVDAQGMAGQFFGQVQDGARLRELGSAASDAGTVDQGSLSDAASQSAPQSAPDPQQQPIEQPASAPEVQGTGTGADLPSGQSSPLSSVPSTAALEHDADQLNPSSASTSTRARGQPTTRASRAVNSMAQQIASQPRVVHVAAHTRQYPGHGASVATGGRRTQPVLINTPSVPGNAAQTSGGNNNGASAGAPSGNNNAASTSTPAGTHNQAFDNAPAPETSSAAGLSYPSDVQSTTQQHAQSAPSSAGVTSPEHEMADAETVLESAEPTHSSMQSPLSPSVTSPEHAMADPDAVLDGETSNSDPSESESGNEAEMEDEDPTPTPETDHAQQAARDTSPEVDMPDAQPEAASPSVPAAESEAPARTPSPSPSPPPKRAPKKARGFDVRSFIFSAPLLSRRKPQKKKNPEPESEEEEE